MVEPRDATSLDSLFGVKRLVMGEEIRLLSHADKKEQHKRKPSAMYYLLILLLICSVIMNVLQTRKIKELRYTDAALRADNDLQPNSSVPPIRAADLNGKTISMSYGDAEFPLIVYVLSPGCSWCTRNKNNVAALANGVLGKYRLLCLSLSSDGLKEYVEKNGITFPICSNLSYDTISSYKLGGTPETIVVSPQGKVMKLWRGAYDGKVKEEIESYFKISLPGLVPEG